MKKLLSTYPKSMMFFHLLGFILVGLAYLAISMTDIFPRGSILGNRVLQTHFLAGLLLLILVIPRFIVRIRNYKNIPPIAPALSRKNEILAHIGHMMLYLWMIVMPLLGWALASASMASITIFGLHIPSIIAQNMETARTLRELHEMCGGIGILLILGHGIAALWHHFKMHDTTMIRMFPWFRWGIKK